jgi:hypothetical protein
MTNRVQWTENVSCAGCGKLGRVTLSRPDGIVPGQEDRVERGLSGFKTEKIEYGSHQFRCVDCNGVAKITKAN